MQAFNFATDSRPHREVKVEEPEVKTIKARVLDPKILQEPIPLPKPPVALTEPSSPLLRTRERIALRKAIESTKETEVEKDEDFVFKARPMPINPPFVPKPSEKVLTDLEPFSLKYVFIQICKLSSPDMLSFVGLKNEEPLQLRSCIRNWKKNGNEKKKSDSSKPNRCQF